MPEREFCLIHGYQFMKKWPDRFGPFETCIACDKDRDMTTDTWAEDCLRERGKVLTGKKRHYCQEWDFLPIDETTLEWPCGCPAEDDSYDADNRLKTEPQS